MAGSAQHPTGMLIGKVGAGKTTLFNKVCDANRLAEITDDSCTREFASKTVFYGGVAMVLYDGPGSGSKVDTYRHSYVHREGLTYEPLSGVFVTVAYDPRIRDNMGGDFFEAAKVLKPEYFDLIVLVVTKMDQFCPGKNFTTRARMEQHIRGVFRKDFHVERVVFSCNKSTAAELFHAMHTAVADRPKEQLSYTEEEFMTHFDMKGWKGREHFDLHWLKGKVADLSAGYEEGLKHLVKNPSACGADELQDLIYALIRQNIAELQNNVYEPFIERNGDKQITYDDYAASIELQKIIHHAHEDLRRQAKLYLAVNPDDHADWRNAIRRCQYCREVWVKVEGCDGQTECGARPSSGDPQSIEPYSRLSWECPGGELRPRRSEMAMNFLQAGRTLLPPGSTWRIGCGRSIVWKDQAVVPPAELDCLFSTQELENIISSFTMGSEFRKLKRQEEQEIQVWEKLDENGRDITSEGERPASSSGLVEAASGTWVSWFRMLLGGGKN